MSTQVKLTEFADYECPYCGKAYPVVKKLQQEFGDKVVFDFRNFPLTDLHPHALMAAQACEAARLQGAFDKMHDLVFQNQDRLSPTTLMELAEKAGLNLHKFEAALQSDTPVSKIKADVEMGQEWGVQGTPAFFIDGAPFEEQWTYEGLAHAIRAKLKHSAP